MPIVTRPPSYPVWTDGAASRVAAPTPSQAASGFSPGQRPAAQTLNYLHWDAATWIQYLDQQANAQALSAAIEPSMRLLGGGTWTWTASTGVLAWSAPVSIGVPGLADTANRFVAGSVALTSGQVAIVNGNIPFTATASTSSGSSSVTNLSYELGIAPGQTVSGTGIPNGTTVLSVSGTTATLSQSATATGTGVTLTFVGTSTLTPQAVAQSQLTPSPTTIVFARSVGSRCIVGVGSGQFVLRDNEARLLDEGGFATVVAGTAGIALTRGMPVYVSPGSGDTTTVSGVVSTGNTFVSVGSTAGLAVGSAVAGTGIQAGTTVVALTPTIVQLSLASTTSGTRVMTLTRPAGSLFPAEASAATGSARANVMGLAMSDVTVPGSAASVVTAGQFAGFTGLVPGARYYVDPATPGALTTVRPVVVNQYAAPVGIAATSSLLAVAPDTPVQVVSSNPWPQYAAASQADLVAAAANCASGGGGVIVITAPFGLSTVVTVPASTIIQGRKGAASITVDAAGGLSLAGTAELRDVALVAGSTAAATLVSIAGGACVVRGCVFTQPSGSAGTCVAVSSSANRIYNCVFRGVSGTSATGIAYGASAGNIDDSSVFLS